MKHISAEESDHEYQQDAAVQQIVSKRQMDTPRPVTELSKPRIGDSQSRLGVARARLGSFSEINSFISLSSARTRLGRASREDPLLGLGLLFLVFGAWGLLIGREFIALR